MEINLSPRRYKRNDVTLTYLKEQAEAHPLVIPVQLLITLFFGGFDARIGHLDADPLVESASHRVRGMNPAVGVQHVFGNVFRVNAIDRITDVLSGRHDQTERDQDQNRYRIMQAEHWRIDVNVGDLY